MIEDQGSQEPIQRRWDAQDAMEASTARSLSLWLSGSTCSISSIICRLGPESLGSQLVEWGNLVEYPQTRISVYRDSGRLGGRQENRFKIRSYFAYQ